MMGCRVCRARKVKCDNRPNGCRNCERLQLECVDSNGSTVGSTVSGSPPASLRKIRTYRSCTSCRLSKTKCNGERPKCLRCTVKRAECIYDGGSAPRWTSTIGHGSKVEDESSPEVGGVTENRPSDDREDEHGNGNTRPGTASISTTWVTPTTPQSISLVETSDTLSWLFSTDLPPPRHLRQVVEHYFANIHPIRCFAFVHKPSFMRQLDNGFKSEDESSLLHIICAHGAKFHALSLGQVDQPPGVSLLRLAGNQWAKKAESLLLNNYGKVSVQRLMTAVLLYDFRFRIGEYSQALMLSGLAIRMTQALKINTEYSSDVLCTEDDGLAPSIVSRESRRRLMWAVYVLDAWTGSGVEQLTLLRESDIQIQLPCNERSFGLRIAAVTETLGVGHVLQFLSPTIVPANPADNMGIMAYYIRIVTLWKRIVKYINHLDCSPPPWLPESDFAALNADLSLWRRELPDFASYTPDTIYARLDSNQLGGLMLIHCTYHHNFLELYKIAMPDLFKLKPTPAFPVEHAELLQALQADAYFHARQISRLLAEAEEHGARLLSDSLLPFFVYDASRVIIYYIAKLLNPRRGGAHSMVREALEAVEGNNRLLRLMAPHFPISESLSVTVERWLLKFRQASIEPTIRGSCPSEHLSGVYDVKMSSLAASSVTGDSELTLPPISLPFELTGMSVSNTPQNSPRAGAAQQLVKLQGQIQTHERLMSPICEALDLEDLQNFLSWDMYCIMDMSESVSVAGGEMESEWASII